MSELTVLEPDEISVFTEGDRQEASVISSDIDSLLASIHTHELRLSTGYVRLGQLLLRVQQGKFWIEWGHNSFGQYIDGIKERIGRQRSHVYACIGVAEKLLPSVSVSDMERMGISRAQELARFVKQSGRKVTPRLLEMALDGKANLSELHTAVLEELHERGEVKGAWWDGLGGAYFTAEEKAEVQQAVDRFRALNPSDAPEHVTRKETLLAFAREFYSSNPVEDWTKDYDDRLDARRLPGTDEDYT